MNTLFRQVQKGISYSIKLLKYPRKSEIWWTLRFAHSKHRLAAIIALLNDNRQACIEFKFDLPPQQLSHFLEGIKARRELITNEIYRWDFNGKAIFAKHGQLYGAQIEFLNGQFSNFYQNDWTGKVVIDIGGFIGDSALFFFDQGAERVIVYEPVKKNIEAMQLNLARFGNRAETHAKGIAAEDGPLIIHSSLPEGSLGFGIRNGPYQIHCEGVSFSSILKQHRADAIKVDCEGGEEHLLKAEFEELASIPYWIIETHTKILYEQIMKKFTGSGFHVVKEVPLNDCVDLIHFSKTNSYCTEK